MISKQMYKVLKRIPHAPYTTTFSDMAKKKRLDINLLKALLNDAKQSNYIAFDFPNRPYYDILKNNFALTEDGQEAIEEYKRQIGTGRKATWALIIAGLSFVVAVIALFYP
jgi:hypothetical protein